MSLGHLWSGYGDGNFATGLNGQLLPYPKDTLINLGESLVWSPTPPVAGGVSGVVGTCAVGSVKPSLTKAITTVASTAAVGNTRAALVKATTGVQSAASVGSVKANLSLTPTGQVSTAGIGTLSVLRSSAITNVPATGAVGSVIAQSIKSITGVAATSSVGTLATSAALSGIAITSAVGSVKADINLRGNSTPQALELFWSAASTSDFLTNFFGGVVLPDLSETWVELSQGDGVELGYSASPAWSGGASAVTSAGLVGGFGVNLSISLSGVSTSLTAGNVATNYAQSISGVSASTSVGNVSAVSAVSLSGVASTGFISSISLGTRVYGVESSASIGTLGVDIELRGTSSPQALNLFWSAASAVDYLTNFFGGVVLPDLSETWVELSQGDSVELGYSASSKWSGGASSVSGSSVAGSVGVSISVALFGVTSTTATGGIVPAVSLLGLGSSGLAGSVTPTIAQAITGNSTASSLGQVSQAVSLSGVSSTTQIANLGQGYGIPITGVFATGETGIVYKPGATKKSAYSSINYAPAPIPFNNENMERYIYDELYKISAALSLITNGQRNIATNSPLKIKAGDLRVADGVNWNPGSGAGVYCYDGVTWRYLG